MSQQISSPAVQQPLKLKKKFCFASILFLALTGLYSVLAFRNLFDLWYFLRGSSFGDFFRAILIYSPVFCFLTAVLFATVLLFAKQNNFLLGIPMVMFSVEALLNIVLFFMPFDYYYYFPVYSIIFHILQFLAFLAVAIYIFVITAKKKPVSKALCLIPIAVFSLFFIPSLLMPQNRIYLIAEICLYFGIILLLVWVTSPYKKSKTEKTAPVQPAPAAAPVMPKPVAAPVQPVIEKKPVENGQTEPLFGTVDMSVNTDEEVTVDPVMHQFTSPVQPTAKPVEEDPERTIDYSYAEAFYPPVNMPAQKPEAAPQPAAKPGFEAEVDKHRTVMKLLTDYKKLLDSGVISQEDFDKKKNELLNL